CRGRGPALAHSGYREVASDPPAQWGTPPPTPPLRLAEGAGGGGGLFFAEGSETEGRGSTPRRGLLQRMVRPASAQVSYLPSHGARNSRLPGSIATRSANAGPSSGCDTSTSPNVPPSISTRNSRISMSPYSTSPSAATISSSFAFARSGASPHGRSTPANQWSVPMWRPQASNLCSTAYHRFSGYQFAGRGSG